MSLIFTVRPTRWEVDHAHALRAGIEFAKAHDGQLPHNAFWRDIEFRYGRNAEAFSINHPNFKRFLDALILERAEVQSLRGEVPSLQAEVQSLHHEVPSLACDPPTPRTAALSTPEPASWVMLGVAMVAAYWRGTR